MTASEDSSEIQQHPEIISQIDGDMADPTAKVLERLVAALGDRASQSAVFGQPVVRDDVTVIPVARVSLGFGVGIGKGTKEGKDASGGGGGGGAAASPVGYIEIRNGQTQFMPIRDQTADLVVPLTVVAGLLAPKVLRVLRKIRRH